MIGRLLAGGSAPDEQAAQHRTSVTDRRAAPTMENVSKRKRMKELALLAVSANTGTKARMMMASRRRSAPYEPLASSTASVHAPAITRVDATLSMKEGVLVNDDGRITSTPMRWRCRPATLMFE